MAAGLVTADGFDNLRSLIDPKRRAGQGSGRTTRPRHNAGRWALLHADEVVERPRAVEAACWMLLRRYGIVRSGRAGAGGESAAVARAAGGLPPAGGSRRDSRRAICGWISGRAVRVAGCSGVRASDAQAGLPRTGTITLSAADPLNLVGILVPGERVPAISGNSVTIATGRRSLPIPSRCFARAMKLSPVNCWRGPVTKNQGSDEGAPRIPDLRQLDERILQKRFPHRFLPSSWRSSRNACGMPVVVRLGQRLSASRLTCCRQSV